MSGHLDRGRASFERLAWAEACIELSAADDAAVLGVADLERLAVSAYLAGRLDHSVAAWERAHQGWLQQGEVAKAARDAFWLAFVLLNQGEPARGGGWVYRGQRLLDQARLDCVEQGYLRYCESLRCILAGDAHGAVAGFATAADIGDRFRCLELVALARVGQGRCLIRSGDLAGGMALLDEAMAAVAARDVSPAVIGDLYCTVIEGFQEVFDVPRAQEWTEALRRWCDAQPELVLYRGQCLVHRAELMVLAGLWSDALVEVGRACERLTRPRSQPALGAAYYVRADLHRLRGEYVEAEDAYRRAASYGRQPLPGLAQLWLAQGGAAEAESALHQAVDLAAGDPVERARLLGPLVEAALAVGDVSSARDAAEELARIASPWHTPLLQARSSQAEGAVLLVEGDAAGALTLLRRAWLEWTQLEAPYESAHARMLIGLCYRATGDESTATAELAVAKSALQQLGASADVLAVAERTLTAARRDRSGLTSREIEVLRLVATGQTNRAIAAHLVLSERTVATHVSSILHKLGLPSRAAATAYAHQRGLV